MPRSLLDDADLAAVRAAASARPGGAGAVTACLLEGGALAFSPEDPGWPDRDRLVVSSPALARALRDAGGPECEVVEGGRALAVAVGMAAACALEGGVAGVYCVLDEAALDDGALWEAALASSAAAPLVVVVAAAAGHARRAEALLGAAGWRTVRAAASEAVELLGAVDRARSSRDGERAAVVVVE